VAAKEKEQSKRENGKEKKKVFWGYGLEKRDRV
jgi:hypothetical protein